MQSKELNLKIQWQLIVLLFLLTEWLFIKFNSTPVIIQSTYSGPIYSSDFLIIFKNSVIYQLFTIVLPLLFGIALNEIMKYFKAIPRNNFVILIVWVGLMILFPGISYVSPQLFITPLFIYGLVLLMNFINEEIQIKNLISLSFLFSIISLIYWPFIWFIIFLPIGIVILRSFNFRFLMVIITSFIVPYLYVFTYYYLTDSIFEINNIFKIISQVFYSNAINYLSVDQIISLIFLLIIITVSVFINLSNINSQLIQIRRIISLLIVFLLFVISVSLFFIGELSENMIILAIPSSILITLGALELRSIKVFLIIVFIFMIIPIITYFI